MTRLSRVSLGPDSGKPIAFQESNTLAHAWFAGNSMNGVIPADPWSLTVGTDSPGYRLAAPVAMPPVTADPAPRAYDRVLAGAGASRPRDAVDLKVVAGVRDRTDRQIDTQRQDGGWPAIAPAAAPKDSDGDGMPDVWERAHGLNPARGDGAGDRDRDGYTNVEEYLNGLAAG